MNLSNQKQWRTRVWLALVPALLVVNVLLVWQNLLLRSRLDAALPSRDTTQLVSPEVGQTLPPVSALAIDTEAQLELGFRGQRFLLLYFSPECPICTKQFPLWKELVAKVPPSVKVLLLAPDRYSMEEIGEFCASFGFASQQVLRIPKESRAALSLGVTPISMAVDRQGRIEKAWIGGWPPDTVQEVADFFELQFETPSPF